MITLDKVGRGLYQIGIKMKDMAMADIEVLGFDIREERVQEALTAITRKAKR